MKINNHLNIFRSAILGLLLIAGLSACTSTPEGVEPVTEFESDAYLGTWYEIARLDQPFERDLINITATYTPRDDGGITVVNRGYNTVDNEWVDIEGKAYFVEDETIGFLKVAFFPPFYASYIVFETDYTNYAYVTGANKDFLWLLSRTPIVSPERLNNFIATASQLGYDTDALIMVEQNGDEESR